MHLISRHGYIFRRVLILLLLGGVALIFPRLLRAQELFQKVVLTSGSNGFKITQNSLTGFHLINSLTSLQLHEEGTTLGLFSVIGSDGYNTTLTPGDPSLPLLNRLIEVPENAQVKVTVTRAVWKEVACSDLGIRYRLIPEQPPMPKTDIDPKTIPFAFNAATYQRNSFGDTVQVRLREAGNLRGVRLMRLEIGAVLYNAATKRLRICTQLEADVTFSLPKSAPTAGTASPFFERMFSMAANHSQPSQKALVTTAPATYVIVANPLFKTTLKPFVDWKTQKGFNVIEAYTDNPAVGNTPAIIRQYLLNLYQHPPQGMNAPTFLLIVGDANLLPPFHSEIGQHVTDLYYAEYTGDKIPDLFYGRFPASTTAELQAMIDKTLEYEKYTLPDPTYLAKAALIAGVDATHQLNWSNGQIRYASENYFNAAQNINTSLVLQPAAAADVTNTLQSISSGVGFANYTAHCNAAGWANPKLTTADLALIQNSHKYTLMVGNCCQSARFDQDCFATAMLKIAGKGAIGYIGGANDTYWDEDFWWSTGFKAITANPSWDPLHPGALDGAFHIHSESPDHWFVTQGQLLMAGNLAVEQSNSSLKAYYWEIYCLMGDPSLSMYYGIPQPLSHSYPQLLPIGSSSFIIQTDPYAYAAISMNSKLYGAAVAGTDGVAVVNLNPITTAGDADVVITLQNHQPFKGTVRVDSPTGAYILLDSYTIHDASGNLDGFADAGEKPTLNLALKNFGLLPSGNLTLTLSTQDTLVKVIQPVATRGPVLAGAAATLNDAFQVAIDSLTPDRYSANLNLTVSDGTQSWSSKFTLPIRARRLEAGTEVISDPAPGNGNGMADPGETFTLRIPVTNSGQSLSSTTSATLTTDSPWLTLNNAPVSLGDLQAGSSKSADFQVTAAPNTPLGTIVKVTLTVTAAGKYLITKDILLSVGIISEDFESNSFDRLPWEQSGALPWTLTNSNPQQGSYSARSGAITNAQSSTLSITFNILSDGKISFYRKVSSEAGYDRLLFYVDNQLVGDWSGQRDWEKVSYDVTAGTHTFHWTYLKDGATSVGSDCAWIDNIVFPQVNTAPFIRWGAPIIDDNTGNKNGQLDPGEQVSITLPIDNNGLTPAANAVASLSSTSPYLTVTSAQVPLGTMVRGSSYRPKFTATVSPSTPPGTAAELAFRLDATTTSAQKSFVRVIGNPTLIEDFETGNFNALNWLSGGNTPWTIENTSTSLTGKFSARSGAIKDLQTSDLEITQEVVADDSIRFLLKTSSEVQADYLKFFIDGQLKGTWSGETAWQRVAFAVPAGTHTFWWSYQKDYITSAGQDAAWIDNIQFPPVSPALPLAILASAIPGRICQSESALLSVKASGGTGIYSYSWKPSTGLSDPLSATPVATPDATTDYLVEVNDGNVTSSATVHLNVLARPAKPVISISTDKTTLYSSALQGNQWYKDSTAIEGATASSYIPSASGNYSVQVFDYAKCASDRSTAYPFTATGLTTSEASLLDFAPNPCHDELKLYYNVPSASPVLMTLCDLTGRTLLKLVDLTTQPAANYQSTVNLQSLQSGVYLLILKTSGRVVVRKVVKR